jgi:hypothetical protein
MEDDLQTLGDEIDEFDDGNNATKSDNGTHGTSLTEVEKAAA